MNSCLRLALLVVCSLSACKTLKIPDAQIGIQVRSLQSGKVLYEKNQDQKFIPASTLKLFTLATALQKLGPSYQFETQVFYDGNLYLKGSGDPSFSVSDLDNLATQIKQLVKKPIQNIIIDDSVFDRNYYGNGWLEEDLSKGYSAPISGINVNFNRLLVTFLPNKQVLLEPLTQFVKLKINKSGEFKITGHGLDISGKLENLRKSQYKTYAIQDPNKWAGFLFKEALKRIGIQIKGHIQTGLVPKDLKPIASDFSPYLSEMLINYTKFSNNLGNEALLKTLGSGTFEKGLEIVRDFVGLESIEDGSGLSLKNLITPAQMTDFLIKTASNFQIAPEFMSALPIGSNLRAKTGTMTGIRGLAGYFKRSNDEIVAFAVFANELKDPPEKLRAWVELILSQHL